MAARQIPMASQLDTSECRAGATCRYSPNKTLQWRREHDIDNLLAKPHSKFDLKKPSFRITLSVATKEITFYLCSAQLC
jgi:hypothetical protein